MIRSQLLLYVLLLFFPASIFAQERTLQIRLQNAVDIALGEEGVTLEELPIKDNAIRKEVPTDLSKDRLYKLRINTQLKGYAYVGSAPSKERDFDYVLIFNPQLTLVKAKVLIYRETFGRAIETPRWLKQFEGMTPTSSPRFGDNIDGISGATISARSMTRAIAQVLKTINILHKAALL